jgi:hypothetical protein
MELSSHTSTTINELQQKIELLENEVRTLKNGITCNVLPPDSDQSTSEQVLQGLTVINNSILNNQANDCKRLLTPHEKKNVLHCIKLLVSSINGVDILQDDIVISTSGNIDLLSNVLSKKYIIWQKWYEENNDMINP